MPSESHVCPHISTSTAYNATLEHRTSFQLKLLSMGIGPNSVGFIIVVQVLTQQGW